MSIKPKDWINGLPEYVAGRTIDEIKQKYNLKEVYKLASNENILGPCQEVIDWLNCAGNGVNYYPDAEATEIRNKISGYYGVNADNVIMGNGTDQIIEMICDCFIGQGDNIVIADPNFLIYEKAALKCGGSVKKVPLTQGSFRQNIDEMIGAIDKFTKIIFFASPHNPSGTIVTGEEFKKLIKSVKEINRSGSGEVIIVMDEAYYEYVDPKCRIETIDYIRENSNLISLRTFSKIFGLAGLRIGYGIASKEMITMLNKIRLPFNTSIVSQGAAAKALENIWYVEEVRNGIQSQKAEFYKLFDDLGLEYIKSFANFILVKLGDDAGEVVGGLLKEGFIIRPGINLGIPGYARITISTPEVNGKFLNVFEKIYSKKVKK
jgi:histidinol-phosphate aminotransferase